jgi:hypothetical protein
MELPTHRRSWFGLVCLLGLLLLFAAAKATVWDTLDPDCFWHLRVGEQLWREGVHPLIDHLSFASQRTPWTPYSWLAEMGMFWLWKLGGWQSAVAITALLSAGILACIAYCCRQLIDAQANQQSERLLPTLLATTFAAMLSLPYLSFRPVTAVIFLIAVCTALLLRDRRLNERSHAVWAIVPITVLATNMHLFAVFVPMSCAALLLGSLCERDHGRAMARNLLLTVATSLACLCTPMLSGAVAAAMHYQWHDPMVASTIISEMQPFYAGAAGKMSALLVIALIICVIRNPCVRAGEIIWLAMATLLLLRFGRFAPLFVLIAAPILAVTMPTGSDAVLGRRSVQWASIVVLCMGICRVVILFPSGRMSVETWANRRGEDVAGYPVAAAEFVQSNVRPARGRIINEFNWGGYLEWKFAGQYQTLLDGRTQVFPIDFWRKTYLADETTRRQFLGSVDADAAILPVSKSLFRSALLQLGWKVVHRDDRAEVLTPPSSNLAAIDDR